MLPVDSSDWQQMADRYSPLIHNWLQRDGLLPPDTDDAVQEIPAVPMRRLPESLAAATTGAGEHLQGIRQLPGITVFDDAQGDLLFGREEEDWLFGD